MKERTKIGITMERLQSLLVLASAEGFNNARVRGKRSGARDLFVGLGVRTYEMNAADRTAVLRAYAAGWAKGVETLWEQAVAREDSKS